MTNVLALAHGLDLLALQRRAPARYPLLLESVASGTALGRWDMLLVADGARITLGRDGITRRSNGMSAEPCLLTERSQAARPRAMTSCVPSTPTGAHRAGRARLRRGPSRAAGRCCSAMSLARR